MPYTIGLMQSIPRLDEERGHKLHPIRGLPPDLVDLPAVCPFAPRCDFVQEACYQQTPPLRAVATHQRAACLFDVHAPWVDAPGNADAVAARQATTAQQVPATDRG
jgi:oligopeptide transport system ATP-binding protein